MGSLGSLILAAILASVLYHFGRIIYNLFFHPLSSYPGPKLWAISRLPWHWANVHGRLCWTLQDLHRKYGPVIRIGPDELSYTTSTAWKTIYGQRHPEFPKCLDGRGIVAPKSRDGTSSIVTEGQERHAKLRRAIQPAFSERALREQEHYLQTYIAKLLLQLRRAANSPQNIYKWYALTTFDIISELAFGEPGSCLDTADQPWLNVIGNRAKGIVWHGVTTYYGLNRLIQWIKPGYVKSRKRHMQMCTAKVDKRLNQTGKQTDFMSYIVDNPNETLSKLDLVKLASAFTVAGSGTANSALAGTTFFLLRNPEAYKRLVAEIRTTFKTDQDITMASTNKLPYLNACIEEALRMYPPAPSTLPRFVPGKGEFIDGKFIPGGIAVGVHQLSSGLMESNFARAMEFLPERWLEVREDSPFAKDNRSAIQPFSYGPRNCVGKNLGYLELRLILSKVFWNFDLELVENSDDWWRKQKTYLVWEKSPLIVNIRPRMDPE